MGPSPGSTLAQDLKKLPDRKNQASLPILPSHAGIMPVTKKT